MRRWSRQVVIAITVVFMVPAVASAQFQSSTDYSMNESQVGGNGLFNSTSNDYSINPATDDGGESLGAATVGNSSSTDYQTNAGFDTTAQPGLMFTLSNGSVNLGVLSSGAENTATTTFNVRDYTSSGYNIYIIGTAPTYGSTTLTGLATDSAYSTNTAEFGINLVSNASVSGSANPVCQAAGFCYGVAGNGSTGTYGTTRPYTIPNEFRFNSGEVVASSSKSSGETIYTLSFMAGINTYTPGGKYQGSIALVATGSY